MNLVNVSGRSPVTHKVRGLVNLGNSDLPIPQTVVGSESSEISTLVGITRDWTCGRCYVRLVFSDDMYPHYKHTLCTRESLGQSILALKQFAEDAHLAEFDIVIQPMVRFTWSAALLVKDGHILLEVVYGAGKTLFRQGLFHSRYVLNQRMELLDEEHVPQHLGVLWDGDKWTEVYDIKEAFPLTDYHEELRKVSLTDNSLYEVGFEDRYLNLLEHKRVAPQAFASLATEGLSRPFVICRSHVQTRSLEVRVDYPVFERISDIEPGQTVTVTHGAYLSHFAYAMMLREITCIYV